MTDDIVARLRNCNCIPHCLCGQAADEIERLRAERDEARRAVCCGALPPEYRGWGQEAVDLALRAIAKQQGWDCYEEETDGK